MRFRTKLFIIWSGVVLLLWAGTWWSVRSAIQSSFDRVADHGFAGTRRDLHRMQAERVRAMRQAAAMVMNIPELRALIAEHNFEISSENLESLQERLDNLAIVVGVNFVCVLDARGNVIAQNRTSPWKTLAELNAYLKTSPQGGAMVNTVFRRAAGSARTATADAFGMWPWQGGLLQVVGVPLVFNTDAGGIPAVDGGLWMAAPVTDDLAADLAQSHDCQVSFLSGDLLAACSLAAPLKAELRAAYPNIKWGKDKTTDLILGGVSYRSSMEVLTDPCSGEPVGAMLIQSDLKHARTAHDSVSRRLIVSMAGGLVAAALASFVVSGTVTRPVRELSRGVQRLAKCDLEVSIPVQSQDELGTLAKTFNDMVRQLRVRRELERQVEEQRASSQAKSQFLATMSHEIRTPLNGVIGMAELLLRTTLNDRQRRYAGMVKSSAEVLTALINDILDFSKIEAGKLELESIDFNLHELTEDVVELLAIKAQAKGLQVASDIRPQVCQWVRGDPTRVRQVIVNLINNAVKFTEAGDVLVSVLAECGDGGRQYIRIEVSDTGIGIPPQQMDRLFQSFSQVDVSTTRRFGGTGLGLAICKQLVELMGGKIGVTSEPNVGSTFWFALPLEKAQRDRNPADALANGLGGVRVMIVDANATYRRILSDVIASWGGSAISAASEQAAIDTLSGASESAWPHVALVDTQTIADGGSRLLRASEQRDDRNEIRIVMLVPLGKEPEAGNPLGARIAGHVTKPVRQAQLKQALQVALNGFEKVSTNLPAPPAATARNKPALGEHSRRILVAEDNEINQMVAADLLAEAGYACDVVGDGQAAVAACERGGYDLVLMDCQMPRMDGFAATREIRSRERAAGTDAPHVPIIALTANATGSDRERCLAAGMDAYVGKPFDAGQLLEMIRSMLPTMKNNIEGEGQITAAQKGDQIAGAFGDDAVDPAKEQAFNIDELLSRCSGNSKLALAVLEKFEKQSVDAVAGLERLMADGDFAQMASVAHRLKGTAGVMSAEGLQAVAARVEERSRAGQVDSMAHELEHLNREVNKCIAYAATARAKMQGGGGRPLSQGAANE